MFWCFGILAILLFIDGYNTGKIENNNLNGLKINKQLFDQVKKDYISKLSAIQLVKQAHSHKRDLVFIEDANQLQQSRNDLARRWILRANNESLMTEVYATNCDPTMGHGYKGTGTFAPSFIALEYEMTVFVVAQIFGFVPTIVQTFFDPASVIMTGPDTMQIFYFINFTTGFNGVGYSISGIFRAVDYIQFAPGTTTILFVYSDFSDAFLRASLIAAGAAATPQGVCQFIYISCNGSDALGGPRPYINLTNYTSMDDCVNDLTSLAKSPCPYPAQSHSGQCKLIHALSAAFVPTVHCPHTRKYNSTVCFDQCLPQCASCDVNAECVGSVPGIQSNDFTTVYYCQCKPGFVGNGNTCTPLACTGGSHNLCPAATGSYNCTTGSCTCTKTFDYNPSNYSNNNLCTCPSPKKTQWTDAGQFSCVDQGGCVDDNHRWMCSSMWGFDYNQVTCQPLAGNFWTYFNYCRCNYGFGGGINFPCTCSNSSRVLWSPTFNGEVCLNQTECTENWHCTTNHCVKQPGQQVGTCGTRKRDSDILLF